MLRRVLFASEAMLFSEGMIDGLLLAALAKGSETIRTLVPCLAPPLRIEVGEHLSRLSALSAQDRAAELKARASRSFSLSASPQGLPPRMRALLASQQPEPRSAHAWANEAPRPRRGFRATPEVLRALRRCAVADAARRERVVRRDQELAELRLLCEAPWGA